ncbi:hypothetical protein LINPERHAP1_LOCUS7083, partial [Linum perenne]
MVAARGGGLQLALSSTEEDDGGSGRSGFCGSGRRRLGEVWVSVLQEKLTWQQLPLTL